MKPAMETAAEENAEQSQEKKVITRPEMEIGRYHWMYRSSRPHRYHHVPALRGNISPLGIQAEALEMVWQFHMPVLSISGLRPQKDPILFSGSFI
uniref:Uncharacterized protein n=1 Tax=Amazona collaria TaxID=241587 RepID=A0A8B9EXB8_9PSIT